MRFASTGARFLGISKKFSSNIFLGLGFENPPQNPCKTRSEPLKNRCQKRVVFFNIDFLRIRRQSWKLLGLQLATKLGLKLQKNLWACPCEPSQIRHLQKIASWRPPGSILEDPKLDFGGSWDDVFEIWGLLARKMLELLSASSFNCAIPAWSSS